MNMTCKIAMDLAELYKEQLVSEESKKAIESHLKECASCRRYYAELDTLRESALHSTMQSAEAADAIELTEARTWKSLSARIRRRRFFEVVGTSAAIGAGSIMLVIGLILMTSSARERRAGRH